MEDVYKLLGLAVFGGTAIVSAFVGYTVSHDNEMMWLVVITFCLCAFVVSCGSSIAIGYGMLSMYYRRRAEMDVTSIEVRTAVGRGRALDAKTGRLLEGGGNASPWTDPSVLLGGVGPEDMYDPLPGTPGDVSLYTNGRNQ